MVVEAPPARFHPLLVQNAAPCTTLPAMSTDEVLSNALEGSTPAILTGQNLLQSSSILSALRRELNSSVVLDQSPHHWAPVVSDDAIIRPARSRHALRDALDVFRDHRRRFHAYVRHQTLEALPSVRSALDSSRAHALVRGRIQLANLWLGDGGLASSLHFDKVHNMLLQVLGQKHVLLLPPGAAASLNYAARRELEYSFDGQNFASSATGGAAVDHFSPARVDEEAAHHMVAPLWSHGALHCTLQANEALFIPANWSHAVVSAPDTIDLSATPEAGNTCADPATSNLSLLNIAINIWYTRSGGRQAMTWDEHRCKSDRTPGVAEACAFSTRAWNVGKVRKGRWIPDLQDAALQAAPDAVAMKQVVNDARYLRFVRANSSLVARGRATAEHAPGLELLPLHVHAAQQGLLQQLEYWGLPHMKMAWDLALLSAAIDELEPRTIIELGTGSGASAMWLADEARMRGLSIPVHTFDVKTAASIATDHGVGLSQWHGALEQRGVAFHERADLNEPKRALPAKLLKALPHPWLVLEDAHVNTLGVARHLLRYMHPGDYMVCEDIRPGSDKRRAWWAFLERCADSCALDLKFLDFFGINHCCAPDGWMKFVGAPRDGDGAD